MGTFYSLESLTFYMTCRIFSPHSSYFLFSRKATFAAGNYRLVPLTFRMVKGSDDGTGYNLDYPYPEEIIPIPMQI